ncbi:MAG: hypothetical protein M3Y57_16840 [Acidobacteriota bacterium]|nr:hypothetical protein [Acidobacteriota bacterium]
MATKIDEKCANLKAKGFDLGQPTGPEQTAGFGGTFRSYQNGNIYWHPVMGASAHEVHGGILSLYLANGGPGVNPKTGVRQFGFPLSDELATCAWLEMGNPKLLLFLEKPVYTSPNITTPPVPCVQ